MFCIWFTNFVLDGRFLSLGFHWITSPSVGVERTKALAIVFPLESNCAVAIKGSSGNSNIYNFKCLLPPNVMLQYFILILWFWYGMLLVVNVVNLLLIISMLANSSRLRGMYLLRAVGSKKVISIIGLLLSLNGYYLSTVQL